MKPPETAVRIKYPVYSLLIHRLPLMGEDVPYRSLTSAQRGDKKNFFCTPVTSHWSPVEKYRMVYNLRPVCTAENLMVQILTSELTQTKRNVLLRSSKGFNRRKITNNAKKVSYTKFKPFYLLVSSRVLKPLVCKSMSCKNITLLTALSTRLINLLWPKTNIPVTLWNYCKPLIKS